MDSFSFPQAGRINRMNRSMDIKIYRFIDGCPLLSHLNGLWQACCFLVYTVAIILPYFRFWGKPGILFLLSVSCMGGGPGIVTFIHLKIAAGYLMTRQHSGDQRGRWVLSGDIRWRLERRQKVEHLKKCFQGGEHPG